jgi:hypothetical protein
LITTITRVTRILLLAMFFVFVVDFSLDSALLVLAAALAVFYRADCGTLECGARIAVCFGHRPPPLAGRPGASHAPPKLRSLAGARKVSGNGEWHSLPGSGYRLGQSGCIQGHEFPPGTLGLGLVIDRHTVLDGHIGHAPAMLG